MKTQINNQRYGVAFFLTILIVFCLQNFVYGINVADRTPQVRDAIVAAAGVDSPVEVTEAHLATITALDLASKNITTLKIGDFDGLTALQDLFLNNNQLTDLPAVLFMRHPEGTARIPTAFPVTVFNGLTSLRKLHLHNNQLTFLREAVFSGLISLQDLYLHNNTVDPLEMTVSLEKVAADAFRAVAPTGAPFDMRLPIRITNGRIVGGATALTIPKGSIASEIFTVAQTPGSSLAVTVDIEALPEPPHQGYALVKSETLPLVVLPNVAPVFREGTMATRTIAENTPSGTNIGDSIAATDANNDILTYNLGGTDAASFRIVSYNGQLRTHAALDYETKDAYTVTITVSDGSLTDTITVTINVTDVHENRAPVFSEGSTTTRSVAENTASGTSIGTPVAATDPDNDPLTYTIGGVDATAFSIDSSTGQLQTKAALDYETKNTYSVTVSVSDGNGGRESISVTITVTDVNEVPTNNAPVFTDGTRTTRAVAENTVSGTNIGQPISATDADNDPLTYTLGGTDAASFRIVNRTGQLRTSASLNYESKSSYTVIVSVSDSNGGTDSITVTINVTDVNEIPPRTPNRAPVFTDGISTTRAIAENTAANTNIGHPVSATDADNDPLTYSLSGTDAAAFHILSTSGQLQTNAALDYETKTFYSVTASVSDGNGGTDSITVTINVTDVNEIPINPPLSERTPQVQDAIVAAVPGVNNANDVTAAHLAAITVLSIADKGITSLKSGDFDGLTGITELYLHKNSISDISPLGGLTSLKTLYLRENSIRDISPLANLTALIKLTLGNNSIRDIPLFENLTNLTDFYLESNSIEDISPLKNMTSLKFLILDNNSISDISPLKNLTNLTDLYLDNTSIEDISALKNLTNLTDLYLHSNSISDISPLKNLTNLEDLNLYNTSIKDISSLENLISLVVLGLNSNSIEDISPLKNMTSLVSLELSGNSISDISPLKNMNALVWLSLDGNPISDYGPLHRLKRANPGVNIDINLNNNPPQFSDGDSTTRAIPENTAVGTNIGTAVAATDTDNHTLTYTLSGNPDAEAFSIVKTSGQLQTKGALDYETQASYTVTVTVYDGNSGGDRISVTITVTDVVGAAPPVETPPMIPENTALLTNFPNPFNPETWIPYQLAKPAKVTLTIYNMRGVVVRELKLGHQPAGMYHSRNRALYWDGRNMFGEQVAAGVYFYTLTTGDFTATRKLLIRK